MTNKTIEDVRRYLAEDVMGWNYHDVHDPDFDDGYPELMGDAPQQYYKDDEGEITREIKWKPDQNISQSFECLEKYCISNSLFWSVFIDEAMNYCCKISYPMKSEKIFIDMPTKPKAIIGAILKAEDKTGLLEVLENES